MYKVYETITRFKIICAADSVGKKIRKRIDEQYTNVFGYPVHRELGPERHDEFIRWCKKHGYLILFSNAGLIGESLRNPVKKYHDSKGVVTDWFNGTQLSNEQWKKLKPITIANLLKDDACDEGVKAFQKSFYSDVYKDINTDKVFKLFIEWAIRKNYISWLVIHGYIEKGKERTFSIGDCFCINTDWYVLVFIDHTNEGSDKKIALVDPIRGKMWNVPFIVKNCDKVTELELRKGIDPISIKPMDNILDSCNKIDNLTFKDPIRKKQDYLW